MKEDIETKELSGSGNNCSHSTTENALEGEMLLATERAKPVNPKPPKDRQSPAITDDPPTLAALGITKNESAKAQQLAALPDAPATVEFVNHGLHSASQAPEASR